jgi:hypothetical protein
MARHMSRFLPKTAQAFEVAKKVVQALTLQYDT